jgi:uncharacterized membrane protein YphA (DoxX/SURF4 family)
MVMDVLKAMNEEKTTGLHILLLRLTLGFAFLTTWIDNFIDDVFTTDGYIGTLNFYLDSSDHISTPFDDFVREVLIPNAEFFLVVQIVLEAVIWISLIFGIFTRLGAALGAVLSANLLILAAGVEWPWTYILLIVGFLICAVAGAGNWYGVDYWLKDRLPLPPLLKMLLFEQLVR